jgi:hypothetical protein
MTLEKFHFDVEQRWRGTFNQDYLLDGVQIEVEPLE